MTIHNNNLGKALSKKEMKSLKGGMIWTSPRTFSCTKGAGSLAIGGCEDDSLAAIDCCRRSYGNDYGTIIWGAPNSCSQEFCDSEAGVE